MISAVIPKFLFEIEDIITLQDKGIQLQEGTQVIGNYKVPCYKFMNLSETEVFDELEKNSLLEADTHRSAELNGYANRMVSILFLKLRQIATMKDKDQKTAASCALASAVSSLATVNVGYAKRFLPLLRSI
jgi:hypothetical protein